ncbi:lumenal Hsp70 protein [Vermiconidia calcicola]|uniref:Lumenal Hsp70 protein n=1 Tax=Vermiconidia calcicola TaxID=1690605 RepID=A0ACC3MSR0_9PEZI|nr:lumenal Hsp70 protein [Vermiconidia calcicola]
MSPTSFFFLLLCLFTSTASAASSVLGIDFGTLNLKAVLVKPGIPLEIVLTKDSKRKETAAVAFKPNRDSKNNIIAEVGSFPERAYGSDALALQGRMPGEVYPNLKPLLGLQWSGSTDPAIAAYKERYPAVQAEQVRELGTTLIKSAAFAEQEVPWSVEELLAMQLANIRRNAEAMAGKGNVVEDAVITVPAFYTADERRAIERAATLAGLDVNALISDGLAVGMDYAKSRTFPEVTKGEKPEHHIVFDMGAGSTTATLLRFQGRSVKDVGRFNKTVQEVAVLGRGWDRTLGGDSFNEVILEDYINKFLAKSEVKTQGIDTDKIKSNGRVMARLWKETEKARQVLSANTETSSSFEELFPDIDFRVKLTRTDYENLVSDYSGRVVGPIKDALAAAKLTMDDIDSIILHGGVVRTPFVQKQLEEIAGGSSKLRSNVNADESAVFGAAFKGAGLSPSFKVKEIRSSDVAGYAAGMTYTDGGKERRQTFFTTTSPVGHGAATKQISFKDKADFSFELYQRVEDADRPITKIETRNLTESVKALKDKFGCEADEISTKFSVKLNTVDGLPEVTGGTVSCEVEGSGKAESIGDSVKDWLGFGGKKKDQEALNDGGDAESTEEVEAATSSSATSSESATSASSGAASSGSKVPEKPKKRTESISVAITVIPKGNPQPSPEELKRMRDRLAAFDRADRARMAREEALNVLESYTYYIRDFLTNPDYEAVSTKGQRDEISKLLGKAREFMEDPRKVSKATRDVFMDKHNELKKLVEPIQLRRKEETARPEKIKALKDSLEQTQNLVKMVQEQVQQANDAKKKAEEFDASQSAEKAASAATASASSSDDLDALEEPVTTDSETPLEVKYEKPEDFSPYTNIDLTEVSEAFDSVTKWLAEKEAAQSKLKPHDEPVLLVKDIEAKATELGEIMKDVLYKKMKAPKSSSSKKAKTSKTKSSKKSKSSSTSAAADEAGEQGPRITINPDDEVPSEEEILSMVNEARSTQSTSKHDEL